MLQCYICGLAFDDVTVIDHGEHVIPNSIGGGLIARGILCQTCGTNLGSSVDAPFYAALKPLCVVFDIRRDRGGRISVPAKVSIRETFTCESSPIMCSIERDSTPAPLTPTVIKEEDASVAHIFGTNQKQINQYAKSQAVQNLAAEGYKIKTDSDFRDVVEQIVLEVRPNSIEVARGILKIAIAFALQSGISSNLIRQFVYNNSDITNDESVIKKAVFPYYPTGRGEAIYEADRYATDDFPPNHQLVLFSLQNRLFCYIDIFGVIQRYVLLSEKYNNDQVVERYLQKCPKWAFNPEDWTVRRPKDLHILANQFEICTSGKSPEDIQEQISLKAKSRPYELCSSSQLEKPSNMMQMLVALPEAQHDQFPTIAPLRARAEIAAEKFASDFLVALATDKLRILEYLRDLDPEQFRITNEHGICPDLSLATSTDVLAAYQEFRLDEFVRNYAGTWSIELKA